MVKLLERKRMAIEAAGHRCQGSPKYPTCRAKEGQAHPETDKHTILVAFRILPGDDESLVVNCTRCLLSRDPLAAYRTSDWRSERAAKGNLELFEIEQPGAKR